MTPDNPVLAQHPDSFEFARDPVKTVTFSALAGALILGAVLAILNFDALQEIGDGFRGRRSQIVGAYFPWIVIVACLVTAAWATWHAVTTGTWKTSDGRVLQREVWHINGDPDGAYERLSTGDPQIYTPLPIVRQVDNLRRQLRAYTAEGMPLTYLTITMGAGKSARSWPLITFDGAAHQAFQQAKRNLGVPYSG